jgi:polyphosphate kinase
VRDEPDGIRRYCHVGTGNYNPKTARLYEDLGLLSSDPELGADLTDLFNFLTGYSHQKEYRKLLVAPVSLRGAVLELIRGETEAGDEGRIVMKMNNLVDAAVIDALYEASGAGVEIDLIVRSICCLRPGVRGLSDRIRVRSIVGRFLEHSRIFAFGPQERRRYLVGSADLMPRNLDKRVEAVVPVDRPELQERLQEILDLNLADDCQSWRLGPDGAWERVPQECDVNSQLRLQELAFERGRRRRSADARRG